ncbi:hypothetical protein [endosymbiont of unidentified scaly snail isolate Monju]|uniref:hypothetical protein n=1 Tax=endosymbiont of unidentified scaly snail isolate Monju TaxID=1248727 RepID=UPI0003891ED7|nr:hypothetical protein [endosymbiont of unidentified scaly snail isolate Monju]BAN68748.1 hypothetical protein EBS_0805 [endosymbiont of unidentified scaly snail isolate Monju]
MDNINFHRHYSRNTLLRMFVLIVAAGALVYWKWGLVNAIYFKDQLTELGWVINGAIMVLFLVGMSRMAISLMGYAREEAALTRFVRNLHKRPDEALRGVPKRSLIAQRYRTLLKLHETHTPINQNALASTLVAAESTRSSLAKFVNNILILTGVFGTIVSLSIALIGASDVLENAVSASGMGMVIHGMSTALSTTITAIVCYVFFGYFYLRLNDAQTNLVSAIEQVTTSYLMPRFQVETDTVLYEFTGLIRSLQSLVAEMANSQKAFRETEQQIVETLEHYRGKVDNLEDHMTDILRMLRLGFRLRDDE